MLNLSLNKLKLIAKSRGIKVYENKSEDLIRILREPTTKISLYKKKTKDIKEEFNELRYKFSKSKMNQIGRILYDIKNLKDLSKPKRKKIEKVLIELEESLFKLKKYYDHDDIKYKAIRDAGTLFNQSSDKGYYKPIKTTSVFDNKNNYIEYKSKGDKDKILSVKKFLKKIRPYLSDMLNDHKTEGKVKVHSDNKVIDYKNQIEWKIH